MKTPSRAGLWLIWCLVVFGAFNIHAAPTAGLDEEASESAIRLNGSALDRTMIRLRDDGDARRYFAYANAILGRPYDAYYVRFASDEARAKPVEHALVEPSGPLWPWRDFMVEYPPGMLLAALAPALLTWDFPTYNLLFGLFMETLLTISVALDMRVADRIRPGLSGAVLTMSIAFVAALGIVGVRRYDATVVVAVSAALEALTRRKGASAGAWLALGAVIKGVPLLLAPFGALWLWREGRKRELGMAALAGLVVLVGCGVLYGAVAGDKALDPLAYHAERPLQIESPYGAALMVVGAFHPGLVHVVSSFGSDNVVTPLEPILRPLSDALPALAYLLALAGFALVLGRAPTEPARLRALMALGTAALIGAIAFAKVFSPQYMLWLLPTGTLAAAAAGERSRLLLIAAALMTQIEYPFVYQTATRWIEPLIGVTALLRDGFLIAAATSLVHDAWPRERG